MEKILKKKQKISCFCQTSFKHLYIMQIFFLFFHKNTFLVEYQDITLLITIKSWNLKHCIAHLKQ